MTTTIIGIALAVAAAGLLLPRMLSALRTYLALRGKRLITCPETRRTEAVRVASTNAAVGQFFGSSHVRLDQCSRWPERESCGQECLQQIETHPEDCLVWNIVSNWYEGKQCAYCHTPFHRLQPFDHPPALMGADRVTLEWNGFKPERLPEIFRTYSPVCWNCHIAETFRRVHPELVVDRHREVAERVQH